MPSASPGLTEHFVRSVATKASVWVQSPIHLGPYSEPQADVALLRPPRNRYTDAHPGPDDILLLIEVADP